MRIVKFSRFHFLSRLFGFSFYGKIRFPDCENLPVWQIQMASWLICKDLARNAEFSYPHRITKCQYKSTQNFNSESVCTKIMKKPEDLNRKLVLVASRWRSYWNYRHDDENGRYFKKGKQYSCRNCLLI